MRNPIDVLNSLSDKAKDPTYRYERLYRNLYNPEFYLVAYKNVYANDGSMTPGMDGNTIDGMSSRRIEGIIASLKDKSYQPHPARREYIPKKNSDKKRPLGIPSANDKLVQEVVRMILESIYEPTFQKTHMAFVLVEVAIRLCCICSALSLGRNGLWKATSKPVSIVLTIMC